MIAHNINSTRRRVFFHQESFGWGRLGWTETQDAASMVAMQDHIISKCLRGQSSGVFVSWERKTEAWSESIEELMGAAIPGLYAQA